MYQIHRPTNQVILHTRTILSSSAPNKNNTVLLDIMAYRGERNIISTNSSHIPPLSSSLDHQETITKTYPHQEYKP